MGSEELPEESKDMISQVCKEFGVDYSEVEKKYWAIFDSGFGLTKAELKLMISIMGNKGLMEEIMGEWRVLKDNDKEIEELWGLIHKKESEAMDLEHDIMFAKSRIEDIEAECLVLRNKIETDREEQTETVKKIKKFKEELNQTETRKFVEFFNNRSKQVEINE